MDIVIPAGELLTQADVSLPKVLTEETRIEMEEGSSFYIEDLEIPEGVGFSI